MQPVARQKRLLPQITDSYPPLCSDCDHEGTTLLVVVLLRLGLALRGWFACVSGALATSAISQASSSCDHRR